MKVSNLMNQDYIFHTIFFFVSLFSEVQILLGAMSILGGFFVFYMGYESLRTEKINDDVLTPDS